MNNSQWLPVGWPCVKDPCRERFCQPETIQALQRIPRQRGLWSIGGMKGWAWALISKTS